MAAFYYDCDHICKVKVETCTQFDFSNQNFDIVPVATLF